MNTTRISAFTTRSEGVREKSFLHETGARKGSFVSVSATSITIGRHSYEAGRGSEYHGEIVCFNVRTKQIECTKYEHGRVESSYAQMIDDNGMILQYGAMNTVCASYLRQVQGFDPLLQGVTEKLDDNFPPAVAEFYRYALSRFIARYWPNIWWDAGDLGIGDPENLRVAQGQLELRTWMEGEGGVTSAYLNPAGRYEGRYISIRRNQQVQLRRWRDNVKVGWVIVFQHVEKRIHAEHYDREGNLDQGPIFMPI